MWQDIDPNAPFYSKAASAMGIAPYVTGELRAPAIPAPVQNKRGLTYKGNGALPNNAYDVAA